MSEAHYIVEYPDFPEDGDDEVDSQHVRPVPQNKLPKRCSRGQVLEVLESGVWWPAVFVCKQGAHLVVEPSPEYNYIWEKRPVPLVYLRPPSGPI